MKQPAQEEGSVRYGSLRIQNKYWNTFNLQISTLPVASIHSMFRPFTQLVSQLIWYAKTCSSYTCFIRGVNLTTFQLSIEHTKRILYSCHRNLLQIGNIGQDLSLFVIKLTTLRQTFIQRFITFERDLFSNSGFLHVQQNTSSTKITVTDICLGN